MNMLSKSAAAVALKAVDVLSNYGWVQGIDSVDADGNHVELRSEKACAFCALGALLKAIDMQPGDRPAPDDIREICDVFRYQFQCDITVYNDVPGRTKEDMISIFNRMAADRS